MFSDIQSMFEKGGLGGKLAGAVVVDNNDPTKNQRVKYRISTLHQGRGDEELIWAIPIGWSAQGNGAGWGDIGIPPIGSKILIFFPENDEHDTYYISDYHDMTTQIADLLENYPNAYGRVDAAGNLLLVNTQTNTARFVHVSGSYVKFNADGSGEIGFAAGLTMFSQGAMSLRSATAINLDAPAIRNNIGASPTLTITPRTRPATGSFSGQVDY